MPLNGCNYPFSKHPFPKLISRSKRRHSKLPCFRFYLAKQNLPFGATTNGDKSFAFSSFSQPQEEDGSRERKKEERKMFREALKVHVEKKMAAVRAFETQKSKPAGILQHLNVARKEHE